jgi:phage shock protein C
MTTPSYKKLYRSQKDRMIAGVAGGVAEYFNVDPTLIRLAFVLLLLWGGGGILLYIIMWIVVPEEPVGMDVPPPPPSSVEVPPAS